jgi:multiple sugar transport system substrate-binding protein
MTGAYQTWQYGPAGWLVDMNEYLTQAAPNYNWNDVLPNLRKSTVWSGMPGAALGGDGAKQWALPWGFELNSVSYNKRIFDKLGIAPPENLPDMKEKAARIAKEADGIYGIGVRGSRSWATIHPGYLSGFTNYGASDFEMASGKLNAAMNSAAGKEFTKLWVEMIKESGPRNWSTYTWYEVGNDLGAGASGKASRTCHRRPGRGSGRRPQRRPGARRAAARRSRLAVGVLDQRAGRAGRRCARLVRPAPDEGALP